MNLSLEKELLQQDRWIIKNTKFLPWFIKLVENEFISPEKQSMRGIASIRSMVDFCSIHVPYYKTLFKRKGLSSEDIKCLDDLSAFPLLLKETVQDQKAFLQAGWLPKNERQVGETSTSGTTGQPVKVRITAKSMGMFGILKQREFRWFRFDPKGKFASIRNSHDLPKVNGKRLPANLTYHGNGWPSVGVHFNTGPFLGLADTTDIEDQVRWIKANKPDYILSQPAHLEQLALAWQGDSSTIKGFEGVSQQVLPQVKNTIENVFSAPVHQNYGLNEIGIVASCCPEGNRFHVHTEHCWVEIVDEKGEPCPPGERGRILVTSLTNRAMPLLRYDTDDTAIPAEGPCACGRTLPGFVGIMGRYRRTALLPPGSWKCWDAILNGLAEAPAPLSENLRQYQLHQFLDGHYELRLACKGTPEPGFIDYIKNTWNKELGGDAATLTITPVDVIPRPKSGKFESFTSDFAPLPK